MLYLHVFVLGFLLLQQPVRSQLAVVSKTQCEKNPDVIYAGFSADAKSLILVDYYGVISKVSVANGKSKPLFRSNQHKYNWDANLSSDQQFIYIAGENELEKWDLQLRKQIGKGTQQGVEYSHKFIRDANDHIAVIIQPKNDKEYNLVRVKPNDLKPIFTLKSLYPPINSGAYCRMGEIISAVVEGGRLLLIDAKTGKVRQNFQQKNARFAASDLSKDGKSCVSVDDKGEIAIWNTQTGIKTKHWNSKNKPNAVAFLHKKDRLITFGDKLQVWNRNGTLHAEHKVSSPIRQFALSNNDSLCYVHLERGDGIIFRLPN